MDGGRAAPLLAVNKPRARTRGQNPLVLNTQPFWAQMELASLLAIFGPQKVLIFRAHPFQWLL
jgi:hypothetical protein